MKYSHKQILLLYNSVFRGYLNYYSFVHNHSRLATYLYWTLKGSCGKLLAAKYTMRSMSRVLKKFGRDLTFKEKIPTKIKSNQKDKTEAEYIIKETKFYRPES